MTGWKPSPGIEATDELMDIIEFDGSISVLAGAGAGKTELLAQKVDYLFTTNKCPWPKRILSLTFKSEAQENIKKRVNHRSDQSSERFDSFTFHGLCKSIITRFKNVLHVRKRPIDNYEIVNTENESNGSDKISMSELLSLACEIITQREDIKNIFSVSYDYVFVDEFQDTTNQQYALLKKLFCNTSTILITVGDINQSIMLWAGACPSIFTDFLRDFNAEEKKLIRNYRASSDIQNVLDIILDSFRTNVSLSTLDQAPTNCAVHAFKDELQEADYIAYEIQNLIKSGIKRNEICVLTKQKSTDYTKKLREKLDQLNIDNLDMNDLQNYLKEPLGKLVSLFLRTVFSPEPEVINELYEIYRSLNRVELSDNDESRHTSLIADFICKKQSESTCNKNVNQIISDIQQFIDFLDLKKIQGRWNKYRSPTYYSRVWESLERHLRNVYNKADNMKKRVKLFAADDAVHVMNIHKCKGLEYQSVYLIGLEDQAFWSFEENQFENNCAIYVALSRAKERICITYCLRREHRCTRARDDRQSSCQLVQPTFKVLVENCKFKTIHHEGSKRSN